MGCCIKISLRDSPVGLPDWIYDEHGVVSFDMPVDVKYSKTKKRKELNDFNSLKGFGILGFALPPSAKNNIIFKTFYDKSNLVDSVAIDVVVYESLIIAKQTGLVYIKKTVEGFHEIQIVDGVEDWRKDLESCFVCDLFTGITYTISAAILELSWANDAFYNGTNNPYYFNLVNYGRWSNASSVVVEDFYPSLNIYYIIKQALCKIGWCLNSPHLESEEGRRLFTTIFRDSWNQTFNPDFGTAIRSHGLVTVAVDFNEDDDIVIQAPVVDSGFYALAQAPDVYRIFLPSAFGSDTCAKICASGSISDNGGAANGNLVFTLQQSDFPAGIYSDVESIVVSLNTSTGWSGEVCWTKTIRPSEYYRVLVTASTSDSDFTLPIGFKISVEPCDNKPYRGDVIEISDLIDCDKTALEVLEGYVHYINGKITVDYIKQCIGIHVPESIETFQGVLIEGFHIDTNPIDLRGKVACKSETVDSNRFNGNRFLKLGFKDGSDQWIEKQNLVDLWSKTIDRGPNKGYNEETTNNLNPIFEATAEGPLDNQFTEGVAPTIPYMWDNQDGEFSKQIGIRILYNYGLIAQLISPFGVGLKTWIFENESQSAIPYGTQNTAELFVDNHANVIYGDRVNDGFSRFYAQELGDTEAGQRGYLIRINNCEFEEIDFRKSILINVDGSDCLVRLTEIKDFQKCSNVTTPVIGYIKTQLKCL